jgi:uncharacterized membrane protein YqaE (UPF0057 family)
MKRANIYIKLLITLIIFLILTYFIKGVGKNDFIDVILSTAGFIFGVILAFSIANRHSRLSEIREALREQDAKFLEIYYLSKMFKKSIIDKIKEKIDAVLIAQIDYKLVDFDKAAPRRMQEFFEFIESLKMKGQAKDVWKKIIDTLGVMEEIQKRVSYQVKNKIMFYEWISLLAMAGIIFFCLIFYINTNSLSSIVTISILCTALVLLLFVLKDLDSLAWQEDNWIWQPLTSLFIELNLLPYYPDALFSHGRLKLEEVKKWDKITEARIAHYPNPYPNLEGKTIEIVKLN